MKTIFLLLFIFVSSVSFSQKIISGKVLGADSKTPVQGASISLKGSRTGAISDRSGNFTLRTTKEPPFVLQITSTGYKTTETEVTPTQDITITLQEEIVSLQDVVVTVNRVRENITKSPVTVERLGARQIQQSPAPDVYSALQGIKGVDLLTQSLGFKSVNIRGFGANNNNRFVQLTDGMDNRSPGLGFGFGNVAGVPDIDIESIEILPGASSSLYGPDALQGLMLTKTKSPFDYQGLSAQVKVGANNFGKDYISVKLYTDVAIRYAKKIGNRLAFKVDFETLRGTDFIADDYSDRSNRGRPNFFVTDPNTKTVKLGFVPNNNPATNLTYDGVNIYGDDFNNGGAFTYPATYSANPALAGKTVTRTGYTELDLLANNGKVFSTRANVALHYKFTNKIEGIAAWYYGNGNFIRTAGFREYYPDYKRNQFKLELRSDDWFLRGYNTSQTAEGYNLGVLAQRLLQIAKPTSVWGADFGKAYTGDISAARNAADAGKFLPGDANFNAFRNELINTLNTDLIPSAASVPNAAGIKGVRLLDNSSFYHTEGMYDFKKLLPSFLEVITGASYRHYSMKTEGTIFPLTRQGNEYRIKEYGWYLQASPLIRLSQDVTIKPTAGVRYDKNQYFKGGFTPRVSGVLTFLKHNFRASWQSAFRNPSPNQLLSDGKTGEVGGSRAAVEAAGLISNPAYTEASTKAYQASVTANNPNGDTSLLVKYIPNPGAFTTEKIKTWEVGYKTIIANRLYIDAFYFHSKYNDFIATQNYYQPKTGQATDLKTSANYNLYAVDFNNYNEIYVNGWGIGSDYTLPKGYNIGFNYTNQVGTITLKDNAGNIVKNDFGIPIIKQKMSDPEVAKVQRNFFISPENRFNINFGNPQLTKVTGFNITYRWTDKMWVEQGTTQGDIWLPAWSTLDAQVSFKIPSAKSIIKIGGSNILNKYYSQGYGLARIGALYYVSINFDELLR